MNLQYSNWATEDLATNESLEAITSGLNLNSENSVLAICGSGDQAFAILEKTGNVYVVDMREKQIEYFLYRQDLLEKGEFNEFLDVPEEKSQKDDRHFISSRNRYFSTERLRMIQSNLRNNVKTASLKIDELEGQEFDRVYLSNVLSYGSSYIDFLSVEKRLEKISKLLKKDGLIYISDYREIFDEMEFPRKVLEEEFLKRINLQVNQQLTEVAQRLQSKGWKNWKPGIIQKIN
jgi:SAM-dependent methyltransferase